MEISIESIILSFSYLGIFGLMVTNGLTMFPSSQVLYIVAGFFIFKGDLSWVPVVFFGATGNTIGNMLLYEVTRRKGVHYALRWNMLPAREIRKLEAVFKKKGAWFLFVGKLIPALKVFVPVAGGIAKTPRPLFAVLMLVSSALWAGMFLSIGYFFGKSSDVFGKYAFILMAVAALVVFYLYKKMNSKEVLEEVEKDTQ